MESFNNKYIINRNNTIYFYADNIRLCNHSNDGYHDWYWYSTNLYTDRTALSKRNTAITSNNIKQ